MDLAELQQMRWHVERLPDGRVRVSTELTEAQSVEVLKGLRQLQKLMLARAQLQGLSAILGDD
jgi:hypothetical protein